MVVLPPLSSITSFTFSRHSTTPKMYTIYTPFKFGRPGEISDIIYINIEVNVHLLSVYKQTRRHRIAICQREYSANKLAEWPIKQQQTHSLTSMNISKPKIYTEQAAKKTANLTVKC